MRQGNSTMNAIMRHMAVACFVFLQSRVAHAAPFQIPDIDPLMSFLTLAAVAVFFWAFRVVRLLSQSENKARQRISELERYTAELEAARLWLDGQYHALTAEVQRLNEAVTAVTASSPDGTP